MNRKREDLNGGAGVGGGGGGRGGDYSRGRLIDERLLFEEIRYE